MNDRAVELDHVLIAVADLGAAGREFEARYGLASLEGGRHPGWGTANRIVPLGAAYLELITVIDPSGAAANPFGTWVAQANPGRPLGWAVRTNDIEAVGQRLGLTAMVGSREMGDGKVLRWQTAGLEQAIAEPSFPFFIQWAEGTPFPGRARISHRAGPIAIQWLHLQGDADRLSAWLGDQHLPITVREGPPAIQSMVLAGTSFQKTIP